jgi:hypothetical protein
MLHLHFLQITLLTFVLLVLVAALFLLAYVSRQQLNKWYRIGSRAIVVLLVITLLATITHMVMFHLHGARHAGMHGKGGHGMHHKGAGGGGDGMMGMSNCDASCAKMCCTYPDKEKGGCLCAQKGVDCVATCCAAHGEADADGNRHHGKGGHGDHGRGTDTTETK